MARIIILFSFMIIDSCFFLAIRNKSLRVHLPSSIVPRKKIDKQDDKKAINTRLNWPEARLVGTSTFGRSTFRLSYRKKETPFHDFTDVAFFFVSPKRKQRASFHQIRPHYLLSSPADWKLFFFKKPPANWLWLFFSAFIGREKKKRKYFE